MGTGVPAGPPSSPGCMWEAADSHKPPPEHTAFGFSPTHPWRFPLMCWRSYYLRSVPLSSYTTMERLAAAPGHGHVALALGGLERGPHATLHGLAPPPSIQLNGNAPSKLTLIGKRHGSKGKHRRLVRPFPTITV